MNVSRLVEYEMLIGMGIVVFIIVGAVITIPIMARKQKRLEESGIDAEGEVVTVTRRTKDGYSTSYYVTYKTVEGELIEKALIGNFNPHLLGLNDGDKIRLRYFDNDHYYVRYMEKIETPKEEKEEDPFEW